MRLTHISLSKLNLFEYFDELAVNAPPETKIKFNSFIFFVVRLFFLRIKLKMMSKNISFLLMYFCNLLVNKKNPLLANFRFVTFVLSINF